MRTSEPRAASEVLELGASKSDRFFVSHLSFAHRLIQFNGSQYIKAQHALGSSHRYLCDARPECGQCLRQKGENESGHI